MTSPYLTLAIFAVLSGVYLWVALKRSRIVERPKVPEDGSRGKLP